MVAPGARCRLLVVGSGSARGYKPCAGPLLWVQTCLDAVCGKIRSVQTSLDPQGQEQEASRQVFLDPQQRVPRRYPTSPPETGKPRAPGGRRACGAARQPVPQINSGRAGARPRALLLPATNHQRPSERQHHPRLQDVGFDVDATTVAVDMHIVGGQAHIGIRVPVGAERVVGAVAATDAGVV